jgi:hypothetical protein
MLNGTRIKILLQNFWQTFNEKVGIATLVTEIKLPSAQRLK